MKSSVRHPGTKRREQIALAALEIIGEQGLASLSTATLAKQVGLSTGGLFRHFASIEEILQEATRIAVETLEATFPEPDLSPTERIRTLGLNRVRLLGGNPGLTWATGRKSGAHMATHVAAGLSQATRGCSQATQGRSRTVEGILALSRSGRGERGIDPIRSCGEGSTGHDSRNGAYADRNAGGIRWTGKQARKRNGLTVNHAAPRGVN